MRLTHFFAYGPDLNEIYNVLLSGHGRVGEDEELGGGQVEGEQPSSFRDFFPDGFSPLDVNLGVLLRQVAVQLLDL